MATKRTITKTAVFLSTTFARLTCDEPTARRLTALFADSFGDEAVVAAFEHVGGDWALELTFRSPPDEQAVRALVGAAGANDAALQFSVVSERDWVAASLADLTPVRAGRFVVHGRHHRAQLPSNAIGIEIEAALAFGTGHHGTTRGCLLALGRWMQAVRQTPISPPARGRDKRILDVGTGTGVLAIAAAKALRCEVSATDIDPVAVRIAKTNAAHNAVATFIDTRVADGRRALPWRGPFDLILANILLGPLTRMARPLANRLMPRGHIVLSGLLPSQANAALAAYRAQGLVLDRRIILENWVTLVMRHGGK